MARPVGAGVRVDAASRRRVRAHRRVDFEEARGEVLLGQQAQVLVQYPAALKLVVVKVHHAVAAAGDGRQELALAHFLVRTVALGAHRGALLRLALRGGGEQHEPGARLSAAQLRHVQRRRAFICAMRSR